jgi:hypothetical protein
MFLLEYRFSTFIANQSVSTTPDLPVIDDNGSLTGNSMSRYLRTQDPHVSILNFILLTCPEEKGRVGATAVVPLLELS